MPPDVLVLGAGKSGLAAARAAAEAGAEVLLLERGDAPPPKAPCDVLTGAFAFDVLARRDGSVGGVLALRGRDPVALEARATVLACGGVGGLWDARFPCSTGDALVLAHRAGAPLRDLTALRREEERVWLAGGVATDRVGRTPVPGLLACGAATGGDVGGLAAGAAAARAPPAASALAPWPELPDLDTPLPEGFADAKTERLRRVMREHLPVDGARDAEAAFRLLHALKGEADDFARARVDPALYALRSACEAALLLAAAARRG